MSTKPTTVMSSAVISLALVNATGKLRTVRNTEKSASFRILCPGCQAGDSPAEGPGAAPVRQVLTCDLGHGPYAQDDCKGRGKQDGDKLVALDADELAAVTAEAPSAFELHIHPADEVAHLTRHTGIVYAFEPGPGSAPIVGMLLHFIRRGDRAFFLEGSVKKVNRLFRLVAAPHGLELAELARPNDVFAFDPVAYTYDEAHLPLLEQIIAGFTTPYEESDYLDGTGERLAAILAAKKSGETATVISLPKAAPASGLEAALLASLAAATKEAAA